MGERVFTGYPGYFKAVWSDPISDSQIEESVEAIMSQHNLKLALAREITRKVLDNYIGSVIRGLNQYAEDNSLPAPSLSRDLIRVVNAYDFDLVEQKKGVGKTDGCLAYVRNIEDYRDNEQLLHKLVYAMAHEASHLCAGRRLEMKHPYHTEGWFGWSISTGLLRSRNGDITGLALDEGMTDIIAKQVVVSAIESWNIPEYMKETLQMSMMMRYSLVEQLLLLLCNDFANRHKNPEAEKQRLMKVLNRDYFFAERTFIDGLLKADEDFYRPFIEIQDNVVVIKEAIKKLQR
jgi:hypothetical protein